MTRARTIQKITSIILLAVFITSTAPRTYFHDLVADHKDVSICDQLHKNTVLHSASYHCHFDDLVVTSSFVLQSEFSTSMDLCFEKRLPVFHSSLFQQCSHHKENRGPPVV